MGMVGGGDGAFIGAVHRMAAFLDGQIELVCGAFSRDPKKTKACAETLFLDPARCYLNYSEMFRSESQLPQEQRMDFVAIVTPNDLHYSVAAEAIAAGFHVMCEKPATLCLKEAVDLKVMLGKSNVVYGLAHTYTGYPMVKEARARVAAGELGKIRKVYVEYPQGWLSEGDQDNLIWRLDSTKSGVSCCVGDIGIHAANLAEYISGNTIHQICADLNSVVPARQLDDDSAMLMRFDNGASGVLIASQVCSGEENPLRIKIYGEKGGLEWAQQEPNTLLLKWNGRPTQIIRTGQEGLSEAARRATRLPPGHPEGYIEAFANLYLSFAAKIRAQTGENRSEPQQDDLPGIDDAIRGMTLIEAAVAASEHPSKWHTLNADQEQ